MKEFKKSDIVTYNLISYTGFKSLLLFDYLLEAPRTYSEIIQYFLNNKYLKEKLSEDTVRVYMTSLKRAGCIITRSRAKGESSRFAITSHPFEFKVSQAQIKAIVKIYRILIQTVDIMDVLAYDEFLRKLANKIKSENLLKALNKVSVFKHVDTGMLKTLNEHAKNNRKVTILYDSPNSGLKDIQLIAKKIEYSQSKLYLAGVSIEYNQDTMYDVQRIKQILAVDFNDNTQTDIKYTTVGYELSTHANGIKLSDNDRIVEIKDDSVIIETETSNMFMMKRKILEYGALCTVLYPEDFRNDIIDTLKKMHKEYEGDQKSIK